MKYILSKQVILQKHKEQYYVFLKPHIKWRVSEKVIELILFFTRARESLDVVECFPNNQSVVLDLLKLLIETHIIVDDGLNKPEFRGELYLLEQSNKMMLFADIDKGINEQPRIAKYIDAVKFVIEQISKFFLIEFDVLKICLYFKEVSYNKLCENGIPKWATCFVIQDCIIQNANSIITKSYDWEDGCFSYSLRAMTHEVMHVFLYNYCRFIPNWFAEGICEFVANKLYPEQKYSLKDKPSVDDLRHFIKKPNELLISKDSNKPLQNPLYYMACEYVRKLLENRSLIDLMCNLKNYNITESIEHYLSNKGYCIS